MGGGKERCKDCIYFRPEVLRIILKGLGAGFCEYWATIMKVRESCQFHSRHSIESGMLDDRREGKGYRMRVEFYYYCPGCQVLLATALPKERYSRYECYNCGWEGYDFELIPECDLLDDYDWDE